MKQTLRVLIWSGAAVLTLLMVILLAIYFALRSPSFNQYALTKWVQPELTKKGIALSLEKLSIDLLGGIQSDKLGITIDSKELGTAELGFNRFNLKYEIWPLLKKQLFLEDLSLTGLYLKGTLKLPPPSDAKPPTPEPETPSSEAVDIYSLLENPPVLASIKNILINITEIDLELIPSENEKIKVSLKELNLNQELSLVANKLSFSQKLAYGIPKTAVPGLSLEVTSENPTSGEKLHLVTQQNFSFALEGSLENLGQKTVIDITKINIQTDLNQTHLEKKSAESSLVLDIPSFSYDANVNLGFNLNQNATFADINSILPLKFGFGHTLKSSPITLKSGSEEQTIDIKVTAEGKGNLDAIIASFESPSANTLNGSTLEFALKNLIFSSHASKEQMQITLASQALSLSHPKESTKFDFLLESATKALMIKPLFKAPLNFEARILCEFLGGFTSIKQEISAHLNNENFLKGIMSLYQEGRKGSVNYTLDLNYPKSIEGVLKNLSLSKDLGLLGANISGTGSWVLSEKTDPPPSDASDDNQTAKGNGDSKKQDAGKPEAIPDAPPPFEELTGNTQIILSQDSKHYRPKFFIKKPLHIKTEYKIDQAANINVNSEVNLLQFSLPQTLNLPAAKINMNADINKEKIYAHIEGELSQLKLAALPKPLDLSLKETADLIVKPFSLRNHLKLGFNQQDVLDLATTLNDLPQNFQFDTKGVISTPIDLDTYIVKLKDIPGIGRIALDLNTHADLGHPLAFMIGAPKSPNPEDFKITSKTSLNLSQVAAPKYGTQKIVIPKPISVQINTTPFENDMNASLNLSVNEAYFEPLGGVVGLNLSSLVSLKKFQLPKFASMTTSTKLAISDIPIKDPNLKAVVPQDMLKDLALELIAAVDEGQKINLEAFQFKLNRLLHVSAEGSVNPQKITASLGGRIDLNPGLKPWKSGDLDFSGGIGIPWYIAALTNQNFTLTSEIQFKDFDFNFAPKKLFLKSLVGKINIQEELNLDDQGRFGFSYLIPSNPFERTDFSKHKPLLLTDSLFIKEIVFDQYNIGPIRAAVALKQNMFNVHQFDLNAFDGSITGELAFNIHPKYLALRLLSRVTQLHPELITGQKIKNEENFINLRTAILYDINKALIEGTINVDKIGSEELISLINVLDPRYEDDQLNSARSALNLAYPTYVNISMDQGQMDMLIDLDALGISKTIEVRKIPLYAFVASATDELLKKIREVPIQ